MSEGRFGYSYVRGWCVQCGRRRGADGRCPHCDPWWTSPVLQAGAPLAALTLIGLIGLISALGPTGAAPTAERARPVQVSPGASLLSRAAVVTPVTPFGAAPGARTPSAFPAQRVAYGFEKEGAPLSREDRMLAELEALRAQVWAADAVARRRVPAPPPEEEVPPPPGEGAVAPSETSPTPPETETSPS